MASLHKGGMWCAISPVRLPGNRRHDWFARVEAQEGCKFRARSLGGNVSHQRMPDKIRPHPARAIPFLFERENAKPAHKPPAHQIRPPGPPGPELRADEIDVPDALAF